MDTGLRSDSGFPGDAPVSVTPPLASGNGASKGGRSRALRTAVVLVGAALTLVACSGGDGGGDGSTITITGSVLILEPSNFARTGPSCKGAGTLAGVREGATVTIDDATTATLSDGAVTGEGNCRFLFDAAIPEKGDLERYRFEVDGMPPVAVPVNTRQRIDWQAEDANGWVTIGWD